ncbi:MAG TPA: HD domain-containing phosphohydrolase [Gaiellaceae bacterium]|nr:HD domain-containing phosphohydrolase [Gaiellaceae bacterium]
MGVALPHARRRSAELLAVLSLAADVGFGVPLETGLRVCALALALGERCDLDADELDRVFRLALLRHIGCTAASDEAVAIGGDEIALRSASPMLDLADKRAMLPQVLRHVARTAPPAARPFLLWRMLMSGSAFAEAMAGVCEAATTLAARLAVPAVTVADLDRYYARWDGKGMVAGAGEELGRPVLVVQVAESANAFVQAEGVDAAAAFVGGHAGTMFAPEPAARFCEDPASVVGVLDVPSAWDAVLAHAPDAAAADPGAVFEVLADFADLRSTWFAGHSRGVAALASDAASRLGLPGDDVETLGRAALAHDVGRAAVSARVWGKEGALTRAEWEQIRLHPYQTERVLSRPEWLEPVGRLAAAHHERLDGSGYFRGSRDATPAARVLAAADVLHALTEPRPHRKPLPLDEAAGVVRAEARAGRLDGEAVEAVLAAAGAPSRRPERPAGLTPREVEVLRLLARGLTKKQIARELVVAPKTADAHVQHIYAKLGVSTRSGATLFAMRSGLMETI